MGRSHHETCAVSLDERRSMLHTGMGCVSKRHGEMASGDTTRKPIPTSLRSATLP